MRVNNFNNLRTASKSQKMSRRGASLIEVLVGSTLVALLVPVVLGTLTASQRIWRQFESGRDATSNRQAAMQEFERRVSSAKRIVSYTPDQLRYEDTSSVIHVLGTQSRTIAGGRTVLDMIETVNGTTQTIAEGIGSFTIAPVDQDPNAGELLEVRMGNTVDPVVKPNQLGTLHSSRLVWKRP